MNPISRRQILRDAATGFGGTALLWMMNQDRMRAAQPQVRTYDLRSRKPDLPPKVKSVIYLYMGGGPSTIDMFDPKPALMKYDGKPAPFEIKGRALNGSQQIMASPWKFKDCGDNGRQVSDLLPYFQKVVDKTTFVRSMTTDRICIPLRLI